MSCMLLIVCLYPHRTKLEGVYWNQLVRMSVPSYVRPSVGHMVPGVVDILESSFFRPSVCRRHGFRSASQVCILTVVIGKSIVISRDIPFNMAAWWPLFCLFPNSKFILDWISTPNLCISVESYRFSATSFSKYMSGSHFGFFGFWTL